MGSGAQVAKYEQSSIRHGQAPMQQHTRAHTYFTTHRAQPFKRLRDKPTLECELKLNHCDRLSKRNDSDMHAVPVNEVPDSCRSLAELVTWFEDVHCVPYIVITYLMYSMVFIVGLHSSCRSDIPCYATMQCGIADIR